MTPPCISLLTDFGLKDPYVGQMKGVIAAINPAAIVIDLTHAIPAQQVSLAAVALDDSIDAFPAGTIHVAVVDPGVGTARRPIAAEIGGHRFVGPDNGLLTLVLRRVTLHRAVHLNEPRWWRPGVSHTFHGRDVFAPVAAAWSLGHDLSEFGSAITGSLQELPVAALHVESGCVRGQVASIDHFGNLITDIPRSAIPGTGGIGVEIAGQSLRGLQRCYADRPAGECVALIGSSGRLEIAVVNGDAARRLGADVGEDVTVRWSAGT